MRLKEEAARGAGCAPLAPKATIKESGARFRMIETELEAGPKTAPLPTPANASTVSRFKAILIQEGLGNTKDGYYYTKEALKSAVAVFEGKKFYSDHPSSFEEQVRPERSVKDAYGHFENLAYVESEDGTGQLHGEIVIVPGEDSDWVRARLVHAVEYAKRYPDKDFLGLSINAGGDAQPVEATTYLEKGGVVDSAKQKLQQAIAEGLSEVKVVNKIDSAISCDLVTEAGAKGRVLQLLEANRMKHEAKKEAEEKKKEADASHDDAEQDKQLIKDELKKHGLIKGDDDADGEKKDAADAAAPAADKKEEAVEEAADKEPDADDKKDAAPKEAEENHSEADAAMMQSAMHYHQAYKQAGYEGKEAAERAVEAMKCAKQAHDSMESAKQEAAKKEAQPEAKKEAKAEEKHKESAVVGKEADALIKLRGENASLKQELDAIKTEKYLDKKLQESGLPRAVTKKFKESVKAKSQKDVDEKFNLFMEGYKAVGGEAGSLEDAVVTEKNTNSAEAAGISLDDCVEE